MWSILLCVELSLVGVMIVIAVRGGHVVNTLCTTSQYLRKLNTTTIA